MLPEFLKSWKSVHPETEIVILNDTNDPVTEACGLETFDFSWEREGPISPALVDVLLHVCKEKDATGVLKLDVDGIHSRSTWLDGHEEYDAAGFRHLDTDLAEDLFFGLCYYISKPWLAKLVESYAERTPTTIPEDQCVSKRLRELGANIKLTETDGEECAGCDLRHYRQPESFANKGVVHCGQFGKSKGERYLTYRMMEKINLVKFPETPKKYPEVTLDLRKHFSRAHCVNLKYRPDRWEDFLERLACLGVTGVDRYEGISGDICQPPHWWRSGNGAWGCLMSHFRIVQDALTDGLDSVLIFEDDVCFSDDFAERLPSIMEEIDKLNGNWDMLYLGGQHLYHETSPPWPFRESLVRCNNVNRTHAFAVSKRFMVKFCQHIVHAPDYMDAKSDMHIDHQLGELHRQFVILAAQPWVCGQGGGSSNITGEVEKPMWWHDNGWYK